MMIVSNDMLSPNAPLGDPLGFSSCFCCWLLGGGGGDDDEDDDEDDDD